MMKRASLTDFDRDLIGGVLVQYFVTCKREAWLYAHKILANQDDENILMGRVLAEMKDEKELHQFAFSNLKFDKISKQKGHYLVTEYKKSLSNVEGAKMQLLFYIYLLKKNLKLKEVKGKIISGKKVIAVDDTPQNIKHLEQILDEIVELVSTPTPPKAEYRAICNGCAYRDYCF